MSRIGLAKHVNTLQMVSGMFLAWTIGEGTPKLVIYIM